MGMIQAGFTGIMEDDHSVRNKDDGHCKEINVTSRFPKLERCCPFPDYVIPFCADTMQETVLASYRAFLESCATPSLSLEGFLKHVRWRSLQNRNSPHATELTPRFVLSLMDSVFSVCVLVIQLLCKKTATLL